MDFEEFPKIPRLSRDIVITEKIDGTNAQIFIETLGMRIDEARAMGLPFSHAKEVEGGTTFIFAGSRTRWITPGKSTDNHGFAGWVRDNAEELLKLGEGRHFGEWWGQGIQRGYELKEKRFSLFNVGKWTSEWNKIPHTYYEMPISAGDWHKCIEVPVCQVVPILHQGLFSTVAVSITLQHLSKHGSATQPGFMRPEGVVIYHEAGGYLFKKTLENDESPKSLVK